MALPSLGKRLMRRVKMRPVGCWPWLGPKYAGGYGQIHVAEEKRPKRAHRVSYELFVGPIPAGHEVHHVCGNPECVRPTHLQAVAPSEHPGTASTVNAAKTHCPQGHDYDYIRPSDGARMCRTCLREWELAHRAERNARRRDYRAAAELAERTIERPYRASVKA